MKISIDPMVVARCPPPHRPGADTPTTEEAQELLREVLGPDVKLKVSPSASGWSGMRCFAVEVDSRPCHLKVSPAQALLPADAIAREWANARWAADRGLGPRVIVADNERQLMLTSYVADASKVAQGTRLWGPVLRATLRSLRALHDAQEGEVVPFETQAQRAKLAMRIGEARASARHGPLALERVHALGEELIWRLSRMPYRQGLCHGDMNGCNSIYTPEKVVIIDWAHLKLGDPTYELAYFGYHSGCEMAQMPRLWRTYHADQRPEANGLERLRLHLALFHTVRYAMRVTGMAWHKPQSRDHDLAKLSCQLRDDVRELGLPPLER